MSVLRAQNRTQGAGRPSRPPELEIRSRGTDIETRLEISEACDAPAAKCTSCARTPTGKIQRSRAATGAFKKQSPCPSTGKTSGSCPGYVIDHVKPLKRGGADAPGNMQWQTKEAAKAKDKVE